MIEWWKRTTVYQLVVRSFADSNGDGIGDLRGLRDRFDYLEWLGVETIWLTPIYPSPLHDFGYDVADYHGVAPEYGTRDELKSLIDELHARGMKLVMDLVLNHTSDQHPWFQASRRGTFDPFRDYYIWSKGRGDGKPPTNWLAFVGGSGWHHDPSSDEWYWASFLPFQPDLNWRNPQVKAAMFDVVRDWLRLGVDGFRLDLFGSIYKDDQLRDNPLRWKVLPSSDDPDGFFQRALYTHNRPETIDFAHELRHVVDEFRDPQRFLVAELYASREQLQRYTGEDGLHLAFDFQTLEAKFSADGFRELVRGLGETFPAPRIPTCVFGNHDRTRVATKLREDLRKAKLVAAFQLTLRAVPFIYYGEELGLPNGKSEGLSHSHDSLAKRYSWIPGVVNDIVRKTGTLLDRDEVRGPMQWSAERNGGFSTGTPWIPMGPASTRNVAVERDDEGSVLRCYRRLLALRKKTRALSEGTIELVDVEPHCVAYRRAIDGERVTVILHFADRTCPIDLSAFGGSEIHSSLRDEVKAFTPTYDLEPYEAIVLV